MDIVSKLIIPLLFGIIIPSTIGTPTALYRLNTATKETSERISNITLQDEDNFGGRITKLGLQQLKTLLCIRSTVYFDMDGTIRMEVKKPEYEIIVVRGEDKRSITVVDIYGNLNKVEECDLGYKYTLPEIQLNADSRTYVGPYYEKTNEMKLTGLTDIYHFTSQLRANIWWQGIVIGQWEKMFKEPTLSGPLTGKDEPYSQIIVLNPPITVEVTSGPSGQKLTGYLFPLLGIIELQVKEQLESLKGKVQDSFWGNYYLDDSKDKFQKVNFKDIAGVKECHMGGPSYLMVNYVPSVKLVYGSQKDAHAIYGLKMTEAGKIELFDSKDNLENFIKSKSSNEPWSLDLGKDGVIFAKKFPTPKKPVEASHGLFSTVVTYDNKI